MPKHRYSTSVEVLQKTEAQVERETAKKWAARARACYLRYAQGGKIDWLLRAESYRHEALEHGSLVGDGGKLVGVLEKQIAKFRPKKR